MHENVAPRSPLRRLARDPFFVSSALVAAVCWLVVVTRLLPPDFASKFENQIGFALLAGTVVASAGAGFVRAGTRAGRWIQGSLAAAFLFWMAAEIAELVYTKTFYEPALDLSTDLLYLICYSLVLLAAESIASASQEPSKSIDRQLELLATILVIDTLLAYYLLLPFNLNPAEPMRIGTFWSYYALFDLLLLARLAWLRWQLRAKPGRVALNWLLLMSLLLLSSDVLEAVMDARPSGPRSDELELLFYYFSFVAAVGAARSCASDATADADPMPSGATRPPSIPPFSPLIAYLVGLPVLHLSHESLAPAPLVYRTARNILIITVTALLGSITGLAWKRFRFRHSELQAAAERAADSLARSRHFESIGRLAAGVAHDFNNRLTVVMMHASLLSERRMSDDELVHASAAISEAAKQASHLTAELLAVGRMQQAHRTRLDLAALAPELRDAARNQVSETVGVDLRVSGRALVVEIDRLHLLRIVWNLISNAADAMPAGGELSLEIGARRLDASIDAAGEPIPDGDYVTLVVSDQGVGISDDQKTRLFDPFFTTKEFGGGSGLGLAAVLGLIRMNAGFILVESAPGQGSRFEVLFPLC
jgi:signal transduction histidine kinase